MKRTPHRDRRSIAIEDEAHQNARDLFMACKGRLYSFHKGKQWRFDSDQFGGWGSREVVLQEVLREEATARKVGRATHSPRPVGLISAPANPAARRRNSASFA